MDALLPEPIREFLRCKILRPLLRMLRGGVTPRRLAWSLALGMVIGINPSVGITTLVVILLAWTLGLNQIASQIGVHAVAPIHLLLFIPFVELGVQLFHTRRLPLSRHQIEHLSHTTRAVASRPQPQCPTRSAHATPTAKCRGGNATDEKPPAPAPPPPKT